MTVTGLDITKHHHGQMHQPIETPDRLRELMARASVRSAIEEMVPATFKPYLTSDRVARVLLYEANRNPKLLQCTRLSVLSAVMALAQCGFEPGGPMGRAYLVPFSNRRSGTTEAQPIIGYKGLIDLMRRTADVTTVHSFVIHANDQYEVFYGDEPQVLHKPLLKGDRGDWIAAYCVVGFKAGGRHIELMTRAEIEAIRARSPQQRKGPSGIWAEHPTQMARKTVIRRAANYVPMSIDLAQGLELEANQGSSVDMGTNAVAASVIDDSTAPAPPTKSDELAAMIEGASAANSDDGLDSPTDATLDS